MVAPSRTKKSNDFTGRQAAELAAQAQADQKLRNEEMAMMTAAQEQEFEETVHDVTVTPNSPTILDEVVEVGITMGDGSIVVRLAEDVENMTYGHGNTYNFKAGGKYRVPKEVAERLEDLGLLYARL
jgi:vacuolar-type H+-ATPase subunit E/Vma4